MGYNTPLVILNDRLHDIRDDANFGRDVYDAATAIDRDNVRHIQYGAVLYPQHADDCRVVAVGGNTLVDIGHVWNGGKLPRTDDEKLAVLKELARDLGYSLRKR